MSLKIIFIKRKNGAEGLCLPNVSEFSNVGNLYKKLISCHTTVTVVKQPLSDITRLFLVLIFGPAIIDTMCVHEHAYFFYAYVLINIMK